MKRKAYERNRGFAPGFQQKPLKKMRKNIMSVEITKEKDAKLFRKKRFLENLNFSNTENFIQFLDSGL